MTGKLIDEHMDQLESWIGTGPKIFTLLYSITRDGCVASTFHQKCDNQGPTVTVLYNQQGSVYGGYTSASWNSPGYWVKDDKAFLYQLMFSGNKVNNKFPCTKSPQEAIYSGSTYGPTFGSGHDLHTFKGTVNSSGGYFALNGYMDINWGCSYDTQGVTSNNVNNGNFNVTELEVYKVTDGRRQKVQSQTLPVTPWRKTPELNQKYLAKLMEEIENTKPMSDVDITEYRILMLGPVGSGKSSFYNTIDSIFRGRISHKAICGNEKHSTTNAYVPYAVKKRGGSTLNFKLCDTRGLDEELVPDLLECSFLLDGHIPDFYKVSNTAREASSLIIAKVLWLPPDVCAELKQCPEFNPTSAITVRSPEFIQKPGIKDMVHCVAFVIDASSVDNIPDKLLDKMKSIRKMMNQRCIPQAVVLAKIDKISREAEENVANAFLSKEVESAVEKVSDLFGIPRNSVLPIKNYEREMHLEDGVSALALMALQQLLYLAEDCIEMLPSQTTSGVTMATARDTAEQEVTESDTA